jgi:hypothetical protein
MVNAAQVDAVCLNGTQPQFPTNGKGRHEVGAQEDRQLQRLGHVAIRQEGGRKNGLDFYSFRRNTTRVKY